MDLNIKDRVAIVTGGSKGIGLAAATELGRAGARLVLSARGETDLEAAVGRLRDDGVEAVGHVADAARAEDIDGIYEAAISAYGQVDIAVCTAGGGHGPLRDFSWDQWIELYELNVLSAVALAMRCVPAMRERKWGRIVFVGSTAGREADPRFAAYGAAKAALLHAAKSLALGYAKHGVLTNCVLPGLTRTEGVLAGYEEQAERLGVTPEDVERRMLELQPIAAGRTGEPAEVADAIAFLCSERASWIAGSALLVDGGTIRVTP
ncbi:3-oxoacyl-[acyl-carrier protein] reductase [Thermomonospora echinospora]|uniref:3-oxoacyl-[acyl-carrier protein] reductase n=1 Tax=Thermomonospora echinospora TaxID=1992 RepID=A0A1H6ANT5_9ACTN|nr:SDR family oxidoreductase [Thermomonospora echinospora]SEG49426.1 3-oxoacyl-[acyl-carrier protein] reductase [Thermomonospora echinospora]